MREMGVNDERGDGLGVGPFKMLAKSVLRFLRRLILFNTIASKPEIPLYMLQAYTAQDTSASAYMP